MLKVYKNGFAEHRIKVNGEDWHIEHKYDGKDILKFEIPDTSEDYANIQEETMVSDCRNLYRVKKIDQHGGYVNVECHLNLDAWKERFWHEFRTTNSTLREVIDQIKPAGWTVTGADSISQRATIEASEGEGLKDVNSLDILEKAGEVYEVMFQYDALKTVLSVFKVSDYKSSGEFFTDELNLKSLGFVGDTSEIATRVYAYGKKDEQGNPLTFASINGGLPYVEDRTYNAGIISIGFSDERYTIKENLLAEAKKRLQEVSQPVRSYECEVRNMGGDMYMYKMVTIIDRKKRVQMEHRVIEFTEYPEAHYKDVVTLSTLHPKIQYKLRTFQKLINDEMFELKKFSKDALEGIKNQYGQ